MKRPGTLVELQNFAFRWDGCWMKTNHPCHGEESIYITTIRKYFTSNNGVYTWVTEKGIQYICPYFRGLRIILIAEGYKEGRFFVPLSNGEHPVDREAEWERISLHTDNFNLEDLCLEVRQICEKKGVQDLPESILKRLFLIPRNGVKFKSLHETRELTEYPLVTRTCCLNYDVIQKLGTYNENNSRLVIHANDGNTYVGGRFEGLIDALRKAGYKENRCLYVPFSNGETVANQSLL